MPFTSRPPGHAAHPLTVLRRNAIWRMAACCRWMSGLVVRTLPGGGACIRPILAPAGSAAALHIRSIPTLILFTAGHGRACVSGTMGTGAPVDWMDQTLAQAGSLTGVP